MDRLRSTTLADVLREHRRSWPQQLAVVCGDARLLYPALDDRVSRLAAVLRGEGVASGERILWIGQNCHRLLEGLLAAAKLGAIFCPVNWRQSADELAFVLGDLRPRVVIWQEAEIGERARAARAATGGDATWIRHDGDDAQSYEARLAAAPADDPALDVDPASPVLCLYTAAFGGRPSGALLGHDALLVQALAAALLRNIDERYIYLNSGPLFHMATFMFTAATFLSAGVNVFTRRADPEEICRLVAAERCTGAFIMGPTLEAIVELNRDGRHDLSSLRAYAGPPAWNAMTSRDESRAGRAPGGYGQTEVGGLVTMGALGNRPVPLAQLRIVGAGGRELPPGEIGEIVVRGPTVMAGYHERPDESAARRAGGWHHTRDLGRREPDGSVTFIGPMTRLIKSGAENIYPAEVERCLCEHPAVADCGVIGVPDERFGQSVKAVVVLRAGAAASAEELIEHCRARIASYKKPRSVDLVDAIPRRGPAVDYDALDARHGGGGYPQNGRG